MNNKMKICICGGGSLGHVCAGVLSSQPDVEVSLLSGHPSQWSHDISVADPDGKTYTGHIGKISSDACEVAQGKDIILLCVPGYLIEDTLKKISPYIGDAAVGTVVSSTGFFFFAHEILDKNTKLFGFQRVPYIARVREYGCSANLLGYKSSLAVATENIADKEDFAQQLTKLFGTPTHLLGSFYEAALTNSNPILHTGRLFTMFCGREKEIFDHNILFYSEWTDEASQTIIDMDVELFRLLDKLDIHSILTLLNYYESHDAASLTRKISSIHAFKGITSPMKQVGNGWMADFQSRYFTEDFPFGLRFIIDLCKKHNIPCPVMDKVYNWGMSIAKTL